MQPLPKHELMAKVMQTSFANWGKRDPKYKTQFKKLDDIHHQIINDALSELGHFTPYQWDVWWMRSHMRYYKQYRQDKMRMLYQMVYEFLSLYSRGKLEQPEPSRKQSNRKAKAG